MKIFISSTAHDLSDFRALAVDRLEKRNHEVLYHESPTFPARLGFHSHDQCLIAIRDCDVVVCIIDKRYGGEYKGNLTISPQRVKVRGVKNEIVYKPSELSITWCELVEAYKLGKHVVTFARQRTLDEKETRRNNQKIKSFKPAYAQKNQLFDLLDWITQQKRDNWIVPYNTIVDFEQKLETWIDELEKSFVPPSKKVLISQTKKIGILVEGEIDRLVIKRIVDDMQIDAHVVIVPMYGRMGLKKKTGNIIKELLFGYDNIIVLVDSDDLEDNQKEMLYNECCEVGEESKTNIELMFVEPNIEHWILAGLPIETNGGSVFSLTKKRLIGTNFERALERQFNLTKAITASSGINAFVQKIKDIIERE